MTAHEETGKTPTLTSSCQGPTADCRGAGDVRTARDLGEIHSAAEMNRGNR